MSYKNVLILISVILGVATFWAAQPAPSALSRRLNDISPAAGDARTVALHKALYGLKLVSIQQGAGIVGIRGMMYFEQGDACDAWTTDQRFTMEYQYPERPAVNNTNRYVAWEAKNGGHFEFSSERLENGRPTEQLRGAIDPAASGGATATYTRPGDLSFALPKGYLLPTAHTNEMIRRAQAGEQMFNAVMFDGTDAEGPVSVTAVIGKKVTADEIAKLVSSKDIDATFLPPEAWHIRMAVFPLKDTDTLLPSYEMDMILHANGVVSYALVDYRTFKIEQKLQTLTALPAPSCGSKN
jgi:hypothetical protein